MSCKVLICDDDQDFAELLVFALTKKGYSASYVLDCESAWPYLKDNDTDVILMDLVVPRMGGKQATVSLKEEWGSKIKIFLISGESYVGKAASESGADGFLQKPFKVDSLLALLEG